MQSEGKSGDFFYRTGDSRYMMKTIAQEVYQKRDFRPIEPLKQKKVKEVKEVKEVKKMKEKAIQILENGIEDVETILNGRKITAFYRCIMGEDDTVCVDGHAYSIWFGDRLTLKDVPNIGKRLYAEITADYVEAARILTEDGYPTTCYEIQAITWVTWRRLHGVTK